MLVSTTSWRAYAPTAKTQQSLMGVSSRQRMKVYHGPGSMPKSDDEGSTSVVTLMILSLMLECEVDTALRGASLSRIP